GATEDQRGFPRPTDVPSVADVDDGCDIGAYEASDLDNDGAEDGIDTCPGLADPDQIDTDGDGDGDLCDACFGTDGTGDADMDGFCADRDCDDSDPGNACLVFLDGFEAGDTGAWTATVP
ncbi:MAG: hypothetical protein AAGF23_21280, partial [Acidobacteriota bacterium]